MDDVAANKATALRFLEATRVSDEDGFYREVTDDLVSWIPPSCEQVLGYKTTVKGARASRDARLSSRSDNYHTKMEYIIHRVMGDGDMVAAFLTIRTLTHGNAPYENEYVFTFRFENGKIAEWGEYLDTAGAFMKFGCKITKP